MQTEVTRMLSLGLFVLAASWADPAIADAESAARSGSEGSIITQWLAAGSGCKAGSSMPGDVTFRSSSQVTASGQTLKVALTLPNFRLRPLEKTPHGGEPSLTRYARECAMRFSVKPPNGMRLTGVTAQTDAEVSKDGAAKLLVQAALKVGAVTIAQEQRLFESGETFRYRKESLSMIPGRSPEQDMPSTACEESKIVGADLTFLVNKETAEAHGDARLVGTQELRFDVSFEPCTPKSTKG